MRTATIRSLLTGALAVALVLAGWAAPRRAAAQITADVYSINYFDVASGDNTLRIVNPSPQNLCANIYLFDNSEVMQTCCSCPVSSNGFFLRGVGALLSNAIDPTTAHGAVKLVSTTDRGLSSLAVGCNPTLITSVATPELRAWIRHSDDGGNQDNDAPFAPAPLVSKEALKLQNQCKALLPNSTSGNICTCVD